MNQELEKMSSIEDQVGHEDPHQTPHVQQDGESVSSSDTTQSQKQSSKEKNFAALREAKERAERERDEALKYINEVRKKEEAAKKSSTPRSDDELGVGEDDLVEGKHLRKLYKKMREQEEQLKQYHQQSSASSAETKIKMKYPDFDNVVSVENINELKESYPELVSTLQNAPDTYTQAVSAYTLIKKLGIHKEDVYKEDKERAQNNASKPRPLSSVSPQHGDSPLSHANAFSSGLTPERIKQLREMNKAARESY